MFQKFMDWLDDNLPIFCTACHKPVKKKNAISVRLLISGTALICPECHTTYFNPFSDES